MARKSFWGRGNGWVLGGLVEILKELPKKDKNRKFYEELFVKLATRVAGLQHPDGFWHASLLGSCLLSITGNELHYFHCLFHCLWNKRRFIG